MTEATVPFRAGREGYASYRIPAAPVGILYETGDFGAYERIVLRRLPVTRLT